MRSAALSANIVLCVVLPIVLIVLCLVLSIVLIVQCVVLSLLTIQILYCIEIEIKLLANAFLISNALSLLVYTTGTINLIGHRPNQSSRHEWSNLSSNFCGNIKEIVNLCANREYSQPIFSENILGCHNWEYFVCYVFFGKNELKWTDWP